MRIIGGEFKGRRFSPPKSFKARPTTDFAKENLFNILNNTIDIEDCKVLDLFGGTGSISYECASRGSTDITTVELNFQHLKFIYNCIEELKLNNVIKPIKADAFKFVNKCMESFDLIFADPPYKLTKLDTLPEIILSGTLLKPEGLLIFEHSNEYDFSKHPKFSELRKYGSVHFSIFTQE